MRHSNIDEEGAVAVVAALTLIVLLLVAAIVVDLAALRADRVAGQSVADMSAAAAAQVYDPGEVGSPRQACLEAVAFASANLGETLAAVGSGCDTFPSDGACDAGDVREARFLAGAVELRVVNPVLDDDVIMQDLIHGADRDGTPCDRVGVRVLRERDFFLASAVGAGDRGRTDRGAVSVVLLAAGDDAFRLSNRAPTRRLSDAADRWQPRSDRRTLHRRRWDGVPGHDHRRHPTSEQRLPAEPKADQLHRHRAHPGRWQDHRSCLGVERSGDCPGGFEPNDVVIEGAEHVVINGDVSLGNQENLAITGALPRGTVLVLRDGDLDRTGGNLRLQNVFTYAVHGRLNLRGTSGDLLWQAPPARDVAPSPFAEDPEACRTGEGQPSGACFGPLAWWGNGAGDNEIQGTANGGIIGTVFVPNSLMELRGGRSVDLRP